MQSKVSRRQQLRWLGACVALVSWNAFFTTGFQNDFNIDFALRARLEYFRRRIQWVLKEFRGPFLEHVTLGSGVIPQHRFMQNASCVLDERDNFKQLHRDWQGSFLLHSSTHFDYARLCGYHERNDAFADCHSSKTVRVSNPKGYIDEGYHDSTLMKAHLRMDMDILWYIDEVAFARCTSLESVEIPSSVNDIWNGAFSSCTSLKRVTMPNTMKFISKHAFEGCTSLKVLTIPKSVTEIEEGAFEGCSSLTLRIPRSSKHARNPTYYGCRFVCTYA